MPHTDSGPLPGPARGSAPDEREHPRDAAQWFARMHSGEATEAERRAFDAWRGADPEHERDYRKLAWQWHAARAIPQQRLRALMRETPAPAAPRTRRRVGLGLTAVCALVAALGLNGPVPHPDHATDTVEFATRKGERRQASLPDGSILHLNSDTRLVVRFDESERRVELARGEAFFEVQRDAARPFVVEGGLGRVTVTGTRFDVRRDAGSMQVSVASGSVKLRSDRWWWPAEHRLTAGQQATARADGRLSEPARVNVDELVAWQRGKVVFNDVPLAAVIREMNRYLAHPARLDTPGLGQHRISGIFNVDDPDALIDALPAIAPVVVHRLDDGAVRVAAR